MAVINKSETPSPILPKETVEVPSLNGDVVVTGLLLKDRLDLFTDLRAGRMDLSKLLALTVQDANGLLLYTQEEWEVFGSTNFVDAINIFKVAKRLNGLDAEAQVKN